MVSLLSQLKFENPDETPYEYQRYSINLLLLVAIFASIIYSFATDDFIKVFIIAIAILSIRFRKLLASGTGEDYERSWVINIIFSRITEFLIISAELNSKYGQMLFMLLVLNLLFTLVTVKIQSHISLPLKLILLLIFVFELLANG